MPESDQGILETAPAFRRKYQLQADTKRDVSNADGSSLDFGRPRQKLRICVTVADTGCGIAADDIEELFRPYKQARHGVAYTGSSSGLGLYISRGIARQMGGDLTVTSEGAGKGSKFVFRFVVSEKEIQSENGSKGDIALSRAWRLGNSAGSSRSFRTTLLGEASSAAEDAVQRVTRDLRRTLRATGSINTSDDVSPRKPDATAQAIQDAIMEGSNPGTERWGNGTAAAVWNTST